jgi:hypothetical protein
VDPAWTKLVWLKIRTGSRLLWMRRWTSTFHKTRGIYWPAEKLLASKEGLCSVDIFNYLVNMLANSYMEIDIFWNVTPCCLASRCDLSKHGTAFTFRVKQPSIFGLFRLKVEAVRSFKMSGTTDPTARRHVPEDLHFSKPLRAPPIHNFNTSVRKVRWRIIHVNAWHRTLWNFSAVWKHRVPPAMTVLQQSLCSRPALNFNFYRFQKKRQARVERKKDCDENCAQSRFQLFHKHSDSGGVSFYKKKSQLKKFWISNRQSLGNKRNYKREFANCVPRYKTTLKKTSFTFHYLEGNRLDS